MNQAQRNKNKVSSCLVALSLGTVVFVSGNASVAAEPADTPEYRLDQIVVTAQRYEKREIDTAASTSVYTYEQLEATGAKNVQEALKSFGGLVYSTYGPGGSSYSTMTSDIAIRGMAGGTLVLVNGTPLNLRGKYNMEDIPIDSVERIEVIRGGGSVLYGSEATGGVINIITKRTKQNSVKVSGGNFGQQDHGLTIQTNKLGLNYNFEKWGDVGFISSTTSSNKDMNTKFAGVERNNYSLTYQFDDAVSLLYNHSESKTKYGYYFGRGWDNLEGRLRYDRLYDDSKNLVQLQYDRDHIKGTVYYNQKTLQSTGTTYYDKDGMPALGPYNTEEDNKTYGFDWQHDWLAGDSKLLVGAAYQNESYQPNTSDSLEYSRHNYSVYGQWEKPLNEVNTLILSARESWTTGAADNRNYDNFSGQGQFLHKLSESETLYANIGQSFKMPTFGQIYGSGGSVTGNPHVKPQTGMHYEAGWKKDNDSHKWRLAMFHYYIEDNITHKTITAGNYTYVNEDFKNTGIELSCDIIGESGWDFNWGVTYGNPQSKGTGTAATGVKNYWDRLYGRWQLNGGATYRHEQWKVSLTGNYLADRVMTPSNAHSRPQKPYFLTTLSVNYALDRNQDIFFTANNLLDRDDVVHHQSSDYYYTPFNFTLGYKSKF